MSSKNYIQDKFTWCLPTYASVLENKGYKISRYYKCSYGSNCYNCHKLSDFKFKPHVKQWNRKCKEHINLLDIQENIKIVLSTDKSKVRNPKYLSKLHHINTLNFVDLLFFWQDITRYHRKIFNNKSFEKRNNNEYFNKKDIPLFKLNNEDDIWAFVRCLRMCPQHNELLINKSKIYNIKDLCPGMDNCKIGVHNYKDLVCIDNLLTGSCKCLSQEELDKLKESKLIERKTLIDIINNKSSDGFSMKLSKANKNKFLDNIKQIDIEINNIKPRMIHYTDQKLIPFSERIKSNNEKKESTITVKDLGNKNVKKLKKKK